MESTVYRGSVQSALSTPRSQSAMPGFHQDSQSTWSRTNQSNHLIVLQMMGFPRTSQVHVALYALIEVEPCHCFSRNHSNGLMKFVEFGPTQTHLKIKNWKVDPFNAIQRLLLTFVHSVEALVSRRESQPAWD